MDRIETIAIDNDRQIAVRRLVEGDSGRTVVFCHPSPGSGTFDPDPEQTWSRGITLLSVDRAGYGASDAADREEMTVGGSADDLAHVLEQAVDQPVSVVGWQTGGWVALALAARHPNLVDRLVVIAAPAPHEEISWAPASGIGEIETLRERGTGEARGRLARYFKRFVPPAGHPTGALELLASSPADDEVLARRDVRDRLNEMLEVAFASGAGGPVDELTGYLLKPWGFEPADVQAKTLLLYGARDPVAGSRHGSWWQRHLPNARVEVSPGRGSLAIVPLWGRTLSHCAPRIKRQT